MWSWSIIMHEKEPLKSEQSKLPLDKIEPNNTLLIGPMPCEKKAAAIRNNTIESMQKYDTGDVAYRYLQCRRGANNTLKEAMLWGSYATIMLGLTCRLPLPIRLVAVGQAAVHVPPNIGNTIRYAETKKYSEIWLLERLGKEKLAEIQSMTFNQAGMFSLNAFLKREKIDAASVENRTKSADEPFSCWNMDR